MRPKVYGDFERSGMSRVGRLFPDGTHPPRRTEKALAEIRSMPYTQTGPRQHSEEERSND